MGLLCYDMAKGETAYSKSSVYLCIYIVHDYTSDYM